LSCSYSEESKLTGSPTLCKPVSWRGPRLPAFPWHIAGAYCLFIIVAAVSCWSGVGFRTEFTGYPDEPAHYVTGLMLRDYIAQGFPAAPMRFAENYYIHYPKVAFGHWPPAFYFLEAGWMLLFGASQYSMLMLITLLMAEIAFVLYRIVAGLAGPGYGLWVGDLWLLLPAVMAQTTMLMTEPLVTLTGLLALRNLANYLESKKNSNAIWFGIWASACMLTKGDGFAFMFVVPLACMLAGETKRLFSRPLWYAAAIVAVLCCPFFLITLKMARQGWIGVFGPAYTLQAASMASIILLSNFGAVLLAVAIYGIVLSFRQQRRSMRVVSACMAAYIVGILTFQTILPAGVEPRKLIMAFPAVLFFAAIGTKQISELLTRSMRPALAVSLVLSLTTACWAYSSFKRYSRPEHGYEAMATRIVSDPALKNAVLMICGNEEGSLIAEVASRDVRPSHFVLRGSKVLGHTDWTGLRNQQLFWHDAKHVDAALDSIPVNAVIVSSPPPADAPPQQLLMLKIVADDHERWKLIYSANDPSSLREGRQLRLYLNQRAPLKRVPILQLDLNETLGRTIRSDVSAVFEVSAENN
jgi:hypothetical protein